MTIINTLKTSIITGTSYKLPVSGPFAAASLANNKVLDQNATEETDKELLEVLRGKKYTPEEIAKRKEIFDAQSTLKSKGYNALDSLNTTVKNLKLLSEEYALTFNHEQKIAIENELTALAKEFNRVLSSNGFDELAGYAKSLANRKPEELSNSALRESLEKVSNVVGANFINQASDSNLSYFKNLDRDLSLLGTLDLAISFKDHQVVVDAGGLSGINSSDPYKALDQILLRTDSALSSFLKGSSLENYLEKARADFENLDKIYELSSEKALDLGANVRIAILSDPKQSFAAHAYLDPLQSFSALY